MLHLVWILQAWKSALQHLFLTMTQHPRPLVAVLACQVCINSCAVEVSNKVALKANMHFSNQGKVSLPTWSLNCFVACSRVVCFELASSSSPSMGAPQCSRRLVLKRLQEILAALCRDSTASSKRNRNCSKAWAISAEKSHGFAPITCRRHTSAGHTMSYAE